MNSGDTYRINRPHLADSGVDVDGKVAAGWQGVEGLSTCISEDDDSWDEDEDLATPTAWSCSNMSETLGGPKEHLRRERMQELLTTEREYVKDLEALLQVAERTPTAILKLHTLLGNTEQVVEVSRQLLHGLEQANSGTGKEQQLGHLFLNFTLKLSQVYQDYCSHYSIHVVPLLKKCEESAEAKEELLILAQGLHSLRPHIISLNTAIIKPVQRILRYPLYLEHLLKDTPSTHPDFPLLQEAYTYLDAAASQVNEYTYSLGLVSKCHSEVDHSLHGKMRRVSLHSFAKKSSRMSTLLSQRLGIITQTACIELEEKEANFHRMHSAVLALVSNTKNLLEAVQVRHKSEHLISEAFGDILRAPYIENIKKAAQQSYEKALKAFESEVVRRVLQPAGELVTLCEAPAHLIQKRQHRKLDYDAALAMARQPSREEVTNTDKPKIREKQEVVKAYEALQYLLLVELPVLTLQGQVLVITALNALAAARLYLQGRMAQIYLQLAQVDGSDYSDPKAAQATAQHQTEWLLKLLPQNLQKHVKDHLGTATIRSKTKPRLFAVEAAAPPHHHSAINSTVGPALPSRFNGRHSDAVYRQIANHESQRNERRSLPAEYLRGNTYTLHSPSQHIPISEAEGRPEQMKSGKELRQSTLFCKIAQENDVTVSPAVTATVLKTSSPAERTSIMRFCYQTSSNLPHSLTAVEQPHQEHEKESEDVRLPESYTALYTFTAEDDTQLSMVPGQRVMLLLKGDTEGWWFVKAETGKQGYVPATYLTPSLD